MPLDTLICGLCEETFTDLNNFVLHKQSGCAATQQQQQQQHIQQSIKEEHQHQNEEGSLSSHQSMSGPGTQQHQLHKTEVESVEQMSKMSSHNEGVDEDPRVDEAAELAFLDDVHNMEAELGLVDQVHQAPEGTDPDGDSNSRTYVILKDAAVDLDSGNQNGVQDGNEAKLESAFAQLDGTELEVLSATQLMASSAMNSGGTTTVIVSQEEFEAILQKQQGQLGVAKEEPPPKKPRVGRAKKGEGKNQILEAVPPSTPRPSAPETNADGKLACPRCKRTFTKERHFNTHKCLASSSYVDISKRDVVKIDSGDEDEEMSFFLDLDAGGRDEDDAEFSAPMEESLQVEREEEEDEQEMDKEEEYHPGGEAEDGAAAAAAGGGAGGGEDGDDEPPSPKRRKVVRRRGRPSRAKTISDDKLLEGVNGSQFKQAVEAMENLPIFKNDDDKVAFESCIDVDLSQVDHMFRVHVIEQELNDTSGMVYNTPTVSSLSVYSCTVCEKVFKSLSHIRLHCITHTDVKPFKCNKCDYTTNSKGNLYTHMRKHTGQYYRCDQCDFKSVNKSHLVEHQMTHDSRRPTCLLCNKDYSTIKSMINHIRKYHTNKAGREYLATFLSGRGQKGNTIIHQCHICNRKFKKRIDRDRHLFIHDIKDLPNVLMCELCDYWASRKVYLDKHYSKHRVIYCCTVCDKKFLSVARLSEHVNTEHCSSEEGTGVQMSDALLQECINKSYYLPEPVATPIQGGKFVNLPTILTDVTEQEATGQQQDVKQNEFIGPLLPSQNETTDNLDGKEGSHSVGGDDDDKEGDENSNTNKEESGKVENDLIGLPANNEAKIELGSDLIGGETDNGESGNGVYPVFVGGNSENNNTDVPSSSTAEFPFSTEYREIINEETGGDATADDAAISGIKTEDGMMMVMMPSSSQEEDELRNEEKSDLVASSADPDVSLEAQGLGGDEANPGEDNSTILMLQNPGSDTEEKEEDEELEEEEDNLQQTETGVEDEEGREVTGVVPGLDDDDPDAGNGDLEPGNMSPEEEEEENVNAVEKGEEEEEEEEKANGEGEGEGDSTAVVETGDNSKDDKIQVVIQKMGYHKMTFDIFKKMRETFGTEECEFCGRLFYNTQDHEMHLRTHTGDKPFACTHCSFRSTTRDGLRRHSEKEHEKIAYQCKECDFLAPTRTRLWNHQLKHLGITGLSCSQCPEKFDSMKQLRAHLVNMHQDMDKQDMEKLTGYASRPQGKMGRRSFKCPHCPRVFIRANSELQKHIWIHEGIKPFACPICPYACRSKNNLQAHMLRHSAEKPFSCSECGKEYKSKTALRWHVRSHKTGKLFKCDKCPYEATQSSHLKRHMEIHNVMKRFVCKHCKFSANTMGYMKIHYAKHHKGQPFIHEETSPPKETAPGKGVFKCLSCGYLFGNLSDLKRHLKVRHHIQMQDIAGMDQMQISEVEVVQFEDTAVVLGSQPLPDVQQQQQQTQPTVQHVLQPAQVAATGEFQLRPQEDTTNLGAVPASTANLIQQIFGINQGEGQQVRVVSEDGQPLDISSDTIILQQDGQLLMTNDVHGGAGMLPGNQYIIQYFNPGDVPQESTVIGGDNSATPTVLHHHHQQPIVSVAAPDQIQLIQTSTGTPLQQHQQTTQYIIASGGGEIDTAHLATQIASVTSAVDPETQSPSILQQPTSTDLNINNSVSHQFVMAAPADIDIQKQQPQLISIDGQTHQILTANNAPQQSINIVEHSVENDDNQHENQNAENAIISMDNNHQFQEHHEQELLSVVAGGEEETSYVTSDVDGYSTQLIISDPSVTDEVTQDDDDVNERVDSDIHHVALEEVH